MVTAIEAKSKLLCWLYVSINMLEQMEKDGDGNPEKIRRSNNHNNTSTKAKCVDLLAFLSSWQIGQPHHHYSNKIDIQTCIKILEVVKSNCLFLLISSCLYVRFLCRNSLVALFCFPPACTEKKMAFVERGVFRPSLSCQSCSFHETYDRGRQLFINKLIWLVFSLHPTELSTVWWSVCSSSNSQSD